MAVADIDLYRWTREEYERLVESGAFPSEAKLELVDGLVYQMAPQTSFHSTGVRAAQEGLGRAFTDGFDIRVQMPLVLGESSEPEPDVAVVTGHFSDYSFSHPTTAVLVVEVAERSLSHDRQKKIPLYARAGIPEAWLLVLPQRILEVYREPRDGAYRSRTVLKLGEAVSPLASPGVSIPVAAFFPWER
ncbi:MAG TPA: Uma2 family endonuclease [Thermoanaerobaculia bacterium]|jgi:Uma2 family endonuclease|nr:Uma2 family endonuclease [Thermoanaerobaculia bacterium]